MYSMMPTSMGPGMDPLSFLVISTSIDLVHSVSIHSSAKNSALWDAKASNAAWEKIILLTLEDYPAKGDN